MPIPFHFSSLIHDVRCLPPTSFPIKIVYWDNKIEVFDNIEQFNIAHSLNTLRSASGTIYEVMEI